MAINIKQTCAHCNGTGIYTGGLGSGPTENPCLNCGGSGVIDASTGTLSGLFDHISPTCMVASCIDSAEYLALVDPAKDGVKVVLSCGFVDMRDGQWARTTLFSIFGVNSLTRAALIAMFG